MVSASVAEQQSITPSGSPSCRRSDSMCAGSHGIKKRRVLAVFQRFDLNGDGTIERIELEQVLRKLDPIVWTDTRVQALMEASDINKDGKLDLEEFIAWICDDKLGKLALLASEARDIEREANEALEECDQAMLETALPAMEETAQAVSAINFSKLKDVKFLRRPRPEVFDVCLACAILLRDEDPGATWATVKTIMSDIPNFQRNMKDFDARKISVDGRRNVKLLTKRDAFNPEALLRIGEPGAASLASWVLNVMRFHDSYTQVKPLLDRMTATKIARCRANTDLAEQTEVVMKSLKA
eukprot:TRINITY_DN43649_c0_g1_i1.p1 TRINITY_DN43649_c0_g1~~TRINITY_DN43649_c0_g1_i1.p1  ORF type:complete len:298 (+),score=74.32 TRINITY_DN43649_c0_g1_i1:133-1026(+)